MVVTKIASNPPSTIICHHKSSLPLLFEYYMVYLLKQQWIIATLKVDVSLEILHKLFAATMFEDPFGDGPFKAVPTSDIPQSAEVPNTTYAAHNYAHQELSASNHDIDILADILPPSAPSPSLHPSSDDAIPSAPLAEQTGFPSYSGPTAQPTGYAATHGQDASLTGFAAQPGLQSPQTSYPIHGQPLSQIGFSGQTSNSSFFGGYSVQPGQTPQTSFGLQSSQPASLNGFPSASGSFPHPGIQVTAGQSLQTNANFGGYNTGLGSIGSVSTQMGQTPAGPSFLTQPATASHIPSQMSLPYSQNQTSNRSMPAQSAPVSTALISSNQPANDKFETKSTVWADTLSRGLVNLNISGSKTYPLADIGVHFDAINRKEKRMEKPSTAPVTSTVTMGKAMGSGSGIGRAGALRPSSNPMAGAGRGMAMGAGAPGASAMGVYGVNQPLGMGMARPVHMGMGMNMGQGVHMQQPTGFPPGFTMPGGYNPMMGAEELIGFSQWIEIHLNSIHVGLESALGDFLLERYRFCLGSSLYSFAGQLWVSLWKYMDALFSSGKTDRERERIAFSRTHWSQLNRGVHTGTPGLSL
ncbi:hypothetical protein RND71_040231 [Anisodus tanguticus]|uniref:Uncharacterized protein n=1 Tax=Anisodus tanguticus TaxID=243964 RepID=A0AAE1QY07_9SOLA|nr:hypothetical protein RND71_040231 [Anisodus tanguticus]